MEVEMEFFLRTDMALILPRARTAEGWLTFGFHPDLDEAAAIATVEMVKLMTEQYRLSSKEALSMASLVVHLRVTQMVNGVRGVHATKPRFSEFQRPAGFLFLVEPNDLKLSRRKELS